MTLREEDLKVFEEVPAKDWHILMHLARYLAGYKDMEAEPANEASSKTVRQGGWVKGEIWMSDDFNDPMEFVSEEEMRVLDTMRDVQAQRQEAAV